MFMGGVEERVGQDFVVGRAEDVYLEIRSLGGNRDIKELWIL